VNSNNPESHREGITLRQAALIAGFCYLLSPVTTAEFSIMPKLVVAGNIDQTAQNIVAHQGLFLAAIFCYLITISSIIVLSRTVRGLLNFVAIRE
jgi:hypothetical protein